MKYEFTVSQDSLICTSEIPDIIYTGNVKSYQCQFTFDDTWDAMVDKIAVFNQYNILLDENGCCYIPEAVLQRGGVIEIGVYGTNESENDDLVRISTNKINVKCIAGAYNKGTTPSQPEQNIWEKVLTEIKGKQDKLTWDTDEYSVNVKTYSDSKTDDEKNARIGADNTLQNAINQEIRNRESADTTIQGTIETINNKFDGYAQLSGATFSGTIRTQKDSTQSVLLPTGDVVCINQSGIHSLSEKSNATDMENGTSTGSLQQCPLRATNFDYKENEYLDDDDTGDQPVGAKGEYSTSLGGKALSKGKYAFSNGSGSMAVGKGSMAAGIATYAKGDNSVAFGYKTASKGNQSFSSGINTLALGNGSSALGINTKANGLYSHAEGSFVEVNGEASHGEGQESVTGTIYDDSSSTPPSSATGGSGESSGDSSIYENIEIGVNHAEGLRTSAYAKGSHAEGTLTVAYNYNTHAEGQYAKAYGDSSHAEGIRTQTGSETDLTTGIAAHAEGEQTIAQANRSHSEGMCTIATGVDQHTQGRYNKADADKAFIIGNGTGETETLRSNCFTVDWSGNVIASGDVTANGHKLSEKASVEYVDKAIQNAIDNVWESEL